MHPIDILIPTYNPKREHLTAALTSLQQQTETNWQALIHDDCSPNGETATFVEPFLRDERFRFVRSEKRLGIGGNWNACLRLSSARIVAYLFQDDLWHPTYVESALKVLDAEPSAGFVSLEHEYRTEGGMTNLPAYDAIRKFRRENVASGLHDGMAFLRYWIEQELHPNIVGEPDFVVMRREVMEKAGPFLEDMPQFLDTEYWLRLLTLTNWYNLTKAEYGVFRVHPSAASAQNEQAGRGLFDRLRCFEELGGVLKGSDRVLVRRARNNAVKKMVEKYCNRVESGKKTSGQDRGALVGFCLRHPFLIGGAILHHMVRHGKKALRGS